MIKTHEDLELEKIDYKLLILELYSETPRILQILASSFSNEDKRLLLMAEAIVSEKATN